MKRKMRLINWTIICFLFLSGGLAWSKPEVRDPDIFVATMLLADDVGFSGTFYMYEALDIVHDDWCMVIIAIDNNYGIKEIKVTSTNNHFQTMTFDYGEQPNGYPNYVKQNCFVVLNEPSLSQVHTYYTVEIAPLIGKGKHPEWETVLEAKIAARKTAQGRCLFDDSWYFNRSKQGRFDLFEKYIYLRHKFQNKITFTITATNANVPPESTSLTYPPPGSQKVESVGVSGNPGTGVTIGNLMLIWDRETPYNPKMPINERRCSLNNGEYQDRDGGRFLSWDKNLVWQEPPPGSHDVPGFDPGQAAGVAWDLGKLTIKSFVADFKASKVVVEDLLRGEDGEIEEIDPERKKAIEEWLRQQKEYLEAEKERPDLALPNYYFTFDVYVEGKRIDTEVSAHDKDGYRDIDHKEGLKLGIVGRCQSPNAVESFEFYFDDELFKKIDLPLAQQRKRAYISKEIESPDRKTALKIFAKDREGGRLFHTVLLDCRPEEVKRAKPDLTVSKITATDTVVDQGEQFSAGFFVENIGDKVKGGASAALYLDIHMIKEVQFYMEDAEPGKGPLDWWCDISIDEPGEHILRAKVDLEDDIEEKREDNNEAVLIIKVAALSMPTSPSADGQQYAPSGVPWPGPSPQREEEVTLEEARQFILARETQAHGPTSYYCVHDIQQAGTNQFTAWMHFCSPTNRWELEEQWMYVLKKERGRVTLVRTYDLHRSRPSPHYWGRPHPNDRSYSGAGQRGYGGASGRDSMDKMRKLLDLFKRASRGMRSPTQPAPVGPQPAPTTPQTVQRGSLADAMSEFNAAYNAEDADRVMACFTQDAFGDYNHTRNELSGYFAAINIGDFQAVLHNATSAGQNEAEGEIHWSYIESVPAPGIGMRRRSGVTRARFRLVGNECKISYVEDITMILPSG